MKLLAMLLLAPAAAGAQPPAGFTRTRLDNGLTVLVQEDHRAPLVSVGMMYAVGARNETTGQTGIAHFVEHMNFRATARFPGSETTEAITRLGGRWNGYTWIDQTYYAATVPREALGLALDIEADRMTGAVFDPRAFERERTSVIAELHSYDQAPLVLYDAVVAASFQVHPYRNNTIGWLTDVEQITRDEAFRFYERFYHPGNAVLAIVGDVDAARALDEVRRRFGAVAAGGESGAVRTVEPEQAGQRRVTIRQPRPSPMLLVAWRAPAMRDPDFPAMVLFDALMAGGRGFYFTRDYPAPSGTPLERALLGGGAATRADTDWQPSRYPYVYTARASLDDVTGLAAAEAALLRTVEEAAAREWTDGELRAARRRVRAAWAADLDDLAGRAHQLAFFEVSGGAELLAEMPVRLERLTRDDVRRFARERLRPEQATVGWFAPPREEDEDASEDATAAATTGAPSKAAPSAPPAPATAGPAPSPSVTALPRPSAIALKNGLRAHLVAGGGAGLVALRARVDLGPPSGTSRAAMVALVTARLARAAAGEPSAPAALSLTLIDEPAAAVNTRWMELSARAMTEDLPSLLALVQARLTAAAAPLTEAEWAAIRDAAVQRAQENVSIPATSQRAAAAALLYPAGSTLAQPPWGSEDVLLAAKPEQVLAAARTWLRPDRVQLALAGAIEEAAARRALQATLERWTPPRPPPPAPHAAPHPPPRTAAGWPGHGVHWSHKSLDDILVVWPGPERDTPEGRAATEALLYLLGETGYAGRLGRALVEPGLVYSVYATLEEAPGAPGFLAVRTASSRANTREAMRRIREVLETAAQGAFTRAELDEARSYLRGRDALRREGSEEAARAALDDATLPRRLDPQALTLDQLNAASRRLFARGTPLVLVLD